MGVFLEHRLEVFYLHLFGRQVGVFDVRDELLAGECVDGDAGLFRFAEDLSDVLLGQVATGAVSPFSPAGAQCTDSGGPWGGQIGSAASWALGDTGDLDGGFYDWFVTPAADAACQDLQIICVQTGWEP